MLGLQQSPVFAEFDGLTVEPPFAVANFAGEQVDVVSADTPVVDVFAEHGFRYFRRVMVSTLAVIFASMIGFSFFFFVGQIPVV